MRELHTALVRYMRPATVEALYDSLPNVDPEAILSNRGAYFRMPRSAEVSASENAGRANRRSAYFMSGAAVFGIWMP